MNFNEAVSNGKGKIIFSFNQNENGLIGVTDKTREGACAAYCMAWLEHQITGKSATEWLSSIKGKTTAINDQLLMYQRFWLKVFEDRLGTMPRTKVTWLSHTNNLIGTNPTSMLNHINNLSINTLALLGLFNGQRGAHVVAFSIIPGEIKFFEPNYGEVNFKNMDFFIQFMREYLTEQIKQEQYKTLQLWETAEKKPDVIVPLFSEI